MILVFGTVCLDRVRRVSQLPPPGGYVEILEEATYLGGEAANTANALRSWGAQVELVGNSFGEGHEAELLGRLVTERGLLGSMPRYGAGLTPVCDIYVTPDGERTMFGRGFRDMSLEIELDRIPWSPGAWFTAEPNMSEIARKVVAEANRRGMRTYLMDFYREDEPIAPGAFWQSSTNWVGRPGDALFNMAWLQQWVARHRCFGILTDGAHGFVAGSPEHPPRHFPAFPAPAVVDSTGAGDFFRAGVLYGLEQDWPIGACLASGAAAAALSVGTVGATLAVPTREAIDRHIAEHPEIAAHYRL